MDKTKYSTLQTVFFILSVAQCIDSLNQPPFAKNVANLAQGFLNDDSGEMNNEIDASTFFRRLNKQNTDGKRGKLYNFHSQRTETQFKSAHRKKSSFKQESQFPAVQQTYWKQVSNREPASIVSFFIDDDDEPKTMQRINASLSKNSKTSTRTFQNVQNNQIGFLTQKAHTFQVADSQQNHKEQKNIDLVKNVGRDNNFSFSLKGLNDAELHFFDVPKDSGEPMTGNQHFVREQTVPRFRDQSKGFFSSKGRNRFSKKSSFFENVGSSFSSEEFDDSTEAIGGSGHARSVVVTDNKKSSKIYYFGKGKDISGESLKKLPIISGVSSNKTALLHQREINLIQSELGKKLPNISAILSGTSANFSGVIHKIWPGITKKKNYSFKIPGNLPNLAVKTNHERNVDGRSRGVIIKNLMLGSGNSAEAPGSIISQSHSKIAAKRTILAGETNLNLQKSLAGNGRAISAYNTNTTSRNNLKNRWKSQAFIFGVKSDSNDSSNQSKLRSVTMNSDSQYNKRMETVLGKETFGFVPNSQSRLFKGKKNNVFIHNINLGSESSAMENKKSTFQSRSLKRFGLSVNSESVRKRFSKLNYRENGIKRKTTGISSAKKVNFENALVTLPAKEIFTFEPVPKNSFIIEKNNVFIKNIKLGSGDYSARGKKKSFESSPLKENGFISDNKSSMGKTMGKLVKDVNSPNLTEQTNSIFESHFKRKSNEKEQINSVSSSVLVHNINLGSKIKNRNVENQGLRKNSVKRESLIGVPMIKQITKYYFGQQKNNSNTAPTSAKQINSGSGSIKKRPSLLVRNIHLGSGNSFMGFTASSIDKNNNTLMQKRTKSRLVKITNTLTNETKTQPITNVFIHSIELGSNTPSMKRKDFMWQNIFSKGKNMNISVEGKTLQLKSASAKNKDKVSVERVKFTSVRNSSLNLGSSPFITEETKETFSSFGSSSGNSSGDNTTNTFVHSINLSSMSLSERKKSVSVLGSKEKVITNEKTLNEKSNLERFPTKIKGMNQRSKKIGGGEGEGNGLISDKPRVNVLNVKLSSVSSITKRKEARNRQVIFKNDKKSLATETRGTGQVSSVVKEEFLTPTFQQQLVFNWSALDNGKNLQRQIHSKKQVVKPMFGNKSYFRYIFSDKNEIDPSNQMTGGDLNVPRSADVRNNDGKNNYAAEYDAKEQAQFVVHSKHSMICRHLVDVIFVLDGSDSIDVPRMEQMKMFVINFMSGFQIHQMAAMFGAVIYSSNVSGVINLGSIANRSSLYAAIHDLPHEMSGTNTARGIQSMREMVAMHSRPEVPKVAIVITDGRSKNYSLTTTQARLAHQEGITIFAVGVGQLIDKNELRDIATYGKDRTVDSFHELQKLTYKLAREVCTLITPTTTTFTTTAALTTITTHAPTMNIITLINQTKYFSLPSNICEKCRLVNGVGYREHPNDCQMYIQCYFVGSVITSVTRDCGPGQFWDQQALTCKLAQLVNCITDRCRISKLRSYQNRNNCRAYWTCIGGKSYGRCCQRGHSYVAGTGCVQNKTCRQSCELKQLSSEICSLKIVPGDDTAFQQDIAGHGWKVQKCAPGTFFNISTCSCNTSFRRHNFTRKCKPEIYLTFDEKDGTVFGSQNGIKSENVTVQNGVADFNGNSRLLLWRFANAYLGKKIYIQVKFMERGHSNHTEAIVSNGDCGHDPSLYIALERETQRMHMGAVTDIGTSDVRIAYNTNGWKEVTYMFDGDHVTASVNRIHKTGRTITGSIESRHCAMQIGAGHGMRNFNGEIDEISFYLCKPEHI